MCSNLYIEVFYKEYSEDLVCLMEYQPPWVI